LSGSLDLVKFVFEKGILFNSHVEKDLYKLTNIMECREGNSKCQGCWLQTFFGLTTGGGPLFGNLETWHSKQLHAFHCGSKTGRTSHSETKAPPTNLRVEW